jgi:hypothetical protein
MSGDSAKQRVLEAIEKLPADATLEDAIERLRPCSMVPGCSASTEIMTSLRRTSR